MFGLAGASLDRVPSFFLPRGAGAEWKRTVRAWSWGKNRVDNDEEHHDHENLTRVHSQSPKDVSLLEGNKPLPHYLY